MSATAYQYVGNVGDRDGTSRLLVEDANGERVELELGGAPVELKYEQVNALKERYVLVEVDPNKVKPDGVPADYDELNADTVTEVILPNSSSEIVDAIKEYEGNNKARKSVLQWEPAEPAASDEADGTDDQVGSQPAEYDPNQSGITVSLDDDQPH